MALVGVVMLGAPREPQRMSCRNRVGQGIVAEALPPLCLLSSLELLFCLLMHAFSKL